MVVKQVVCAIVSSSRNGGENNSISIVKVCTTRSGLHKISLRLGRLSQTLRPAPQPPRLCCIVL